MILNTNYKSIGGEQEIFSDGLFYGVTNSGRSSLRWVILSMALQGKRILVPDFVCQVIIDTLREFDIKIDFYNVQDNFEFCLPDSLDEYSALYIIKYFGHESTTFKRIINGPTLPLIIDGVFDVKQPHINTKAHWCFFNSLRKISSIADFSQIISNRSLLAITKMRMTEFSKLKYQAKEAKFDFINFSIGNEKNYLDILSSAETLINNTNGIFEPEDKSVYLMGCFYSSLREEIKHRQENLTLAKSILWNARFIDIEPEFPSFLPLLLNSRDKVRCELMRHSIYLAIHWPAIEQFENIFSYNILSLPLDSRYTRKDIEKMCEIINIVEHRR